MPHFMFGPLLHRARYTWYYCVRKGAVYLHIQNSNTILQSISSTFCLEYTNVKYLNRTHSEGQQENQQQLRNNLTYSQYFCVQLTALLAASSSRDIYFTKKMKTSAVSTVSARRAPRLTEMHDDFPDQYHAEGSLCRKIKLSETLPYQ